MKTFGLAYVGTLLAFLIIDAIWLGLVARTFYRDQLGDLMLASPKLGVAAVFYLFFALAIVMLAVKPGLAAASPWVAVGHGALLGLAAYATYDLTNLATLKNWPLIMSVVDMIWGATLTAVAALSGYAVARTWI